MFIKKNVKDITDLYEIQTVKKTTARTIKSDLLKKISKYLGRPLQIQN